MAKPKSKSNERDPRTLHKHTWYLGEALVLVRLLQEALWPLKYHVTLGGSVLNNSYADKDLDLFVLPFNNATVASDADVKEKLEALLTYAYPIGNGEYSGPSNKVHAAKDVWLYEGKRVDIFLVNVPKPESPAAGQGDDDEPIATPATVLELLCELSAGGYGASAGLRTAAIDALDALGYGAE